MGATRVHSGALGGRVVKYDRWIGQSTDRDGALVRPSSLGTAVGAATRRASGVPDGSACGYGHGKDLEPFSLGQATPDSVGLVHLERVGATCLQGWTFQTHSLGGGLASRSGRSAFTLWVEEQRACHPAARRGQLPVPEICIGSGKTSGVSHRCCRLHLSAAPRTRLHQPSPMAAPRRYRGAGRFRRWARLPSGRLSCDLGFSLILTLDGLMPGIKSVRPTTHHHNRATCRPDVPTHRHPDDCP